MNKIAFFVFFTLGFILLNSFILPNSFAQSEFSTEFLYEPGIEAVIAFATTIAESAPKIIAAVILLVIGLIVGKIIGKVIEKFASKILKQVNKNENDTDDNGDVITKTTSRDSSKLIAASVRWFVYLFFIIAAINALEFEQLSSALTDLWVWVPNLLAFILIIIVGLIVVNFIGKWLDQELIKKEYGGSKYVVIGVKVIIYAIVFSIALTQLGIGDTIIPILISAFSWSVAIGIGVSIAIGLGFALKDLLPAAINTASKQKSVLKVGQKVIIGEYTGTLTAVELLHIIIVTEDNKSIVIPTKTLESNIVTILGDIAKHD